MVFTCERCNKIFSSKSILKSHLQRKKICEPKYSQEDPKVLLTKLYDRKLNNITYDCEFCNIRFNHASTKSKHIKICKLNPDNRITISKNEYYLLQRVQNNNNLTVIISKEEYDSLKKLENNTIMLDMQNRITDLKLQVQYYKNRKNEFFFQLMLEQFLGGTHKQLSCGVTDITTDDCHSEIKEWKSWKDGVGQLTCYNTIDPKPNIALYLFGIYNTESKNKVINCVRKCNIQPYELKDDNNGVHIIDLVTNNTIYTYYPTNIQQDETEME